MTQQDVVDALNAHLQLLPGLGDVAWEGVAYEVVNGRPYLSPRLSSYVSVRSGAGVDGVAQTDGTYTVTVRRPADEGRQPAGQIAGLVAVHFGRDAVLAGPDGVPIILLQASEQPATTFANWVSLPVVVTFTANA